MGRGASGNLRTYRSEGSGTRAETRTRQLVEMVMRQSRPADEKGYWAYSVGSLEPKIIQRAKAEGVHLSSDKLFFDFRSIRHSLRHWFDGKDSLAVSPQTIVNLPKTRSSMDVYYDDQKRNFLYSDGVNKYVISNKVVKLKNGKRQKVCLCTAKKLGTDELNMRKYHKV